MLIPIDPDVRPPGLIGKTILITGVLGAMFVIYLATKWAVDEIGPWIALPVIAFLFLLACWLDWDNVRRRWRRAK